MPRKVLFIQSSHVWDAITATHVQLMRALDRGRFEVHVACTPRPAPTGGPSVLDRLRAVPDIKIHVVDFGPSFHGPSKSELKDVIVSLPKLPFGLLSLLEYMRKERHDIVHVGPKPRDTYGVLFAKLLNIKSVFHIHFMYGHWMPRSVQWAMRSADYVLGISQFSVDSVVENTSVPRGRIDFVHNTLDMAEWDPHQDGRAIREEFGIAEHVPLIGNIGRLIEWKGHDALIDALALVKQAVPNVRALIVGDEAPHAQGRHGYGAELKERARVLGLEDCVIFESFRRDIAKVMAALDVFVFPAWEEGFGMVVLEAMCMQKPVIAWDNGGPREIVVDGETGLLVEPKNVRALADAIIKLLRDPPLRKRYADAGRKRAETVFAPEDAGLRLADIYERCLARSGYSAAAE